MEGYIADWLNLLIRWLHLITGAAWIGTSFYFNWLNHNIRPPEKSAKVSVVNFLRCMVVISIRSPNTLVHQKNFQRRCTGLSGKLILLGLRGLITGRVYYFNANMYLVILCA